MGTQETASATFDCVRCKKKDLGQTYGGYCADCDNAVHDGAADDETLAEIAEGLKKAGAMVRSRISETDAILGWRGLHIDLDFAEECIHKLRAKARR